MIITVFVTTASEHDQWRAELLEHSWMQSGQPGELVRLVACSADTPLPMHSVCRVVRTMPFSPHPYVRDDYHGYNQAAGLLEWLLHEQIDATLLLLDAETLMLEPVTEEIMPGGAIANTWRDWPKGDGAFGLTKNFADLERFCANPNLKPPKIRFPILIHSSDLKLMAARWLELTALIRLEVSCAAGKINEAHQVAYAIAAAEYRVHHKSSKLAVVTSDRKADRPFLSYQMPVESSRGEIVWDPETYRPWSECDPASAKAGVGRQFLTRLQEYVSKRQSGEFLDMRRPKRCHGVREARLPDRTLLEIPGSEDPLNLNVSAAAIWDLCDNHRTLAEIADVLEKQFEVPRTALSADIDLAIIHLHTAGAVKLETIIHDK